MGARREGAADVVGEVFQIEHHGHNERLVAIGAAMDAAVEAVQPPAALADVAALRMVRGVHHLPPAVREVFAHAGHGPGKPVGDVVLVLAVGDFALRLVPDEGVEDDDRVALGLQEAVHQVIRPGRAGRSESRCLDDLVGVRGLDVDDRRIAHRFQHALQPFDSLGVAVDALVNEHGWRS